MKTQKKNNSSKYYLNNFQQLSIHKNHLKYFLITECTFGNEIKCRVS